MYCILQEQRLFLYKLLNCKFHLKLEEQLAEQKHRFARSSTANLDSGVILSLQ